MIDQTKVGEDSASEERRIVILDALGMSISSKLREAMAARSASGIEHDWTGDEEFYQGYDDENRSEFVNSASKASISGESKEPQDQTGSTVFPNITQPNVDAASARVCDMLLPTDDRNFAIDATPIPDMGLDQFGDDSQGNMLDIPGEVVVAVAQAKAKFDKEKTDAERKADKAQTRIDDWLAECQYHSELRKTIDDAAKIGSGVIKGPVPVKRRSKKWERDDYGVYQLTIIDEIKPASFNVDPWNLFPDPACGESIHNGSHIFERIHVSPKKLEDCIGMPGHIESQILKCLEEGPKTHSESEKRNFSGRSKRTQFEKWVFHGMITNEELKSAGVAIDSDERPGKSRAAILTMVNDRVIHASLNPIDSGEFPYDVIPWKRRPGMPWGMGVARQGRTPQRIVVAATRNLMDNAGLGGGPQFVVRRGVEPQNGIWEVCPRKIWIEGDETPTNGSAGLPFDVAVVPMLQEELLEIIQFGMKMFEDVTGIPSLIQGQQGSAPDTVGGMTILNNNANAVLRRVARLFDSCITEPHIRRYYAWLMEYGEDDDEKGDFQIVARGSTALVERDIQSQEMVNVVQLCRDPVFKKNPAKAMDEYLKSRRFDPATFDYTEEELKQAAEQKPPVAPQIEVAKIRADVEMKKLAAEQQESALDRDLEQRKMEIDVRLASEELTSEERRDLEKQKVLLASVTLRLKVQERMSQSSMEHQKDVTVGQHMVDIYKHKSQQAIQPAAEPAGRAKPGKSFTQ